MITRNSGFVPAAVFLVTGALLPLLAPPFLRAQSAASVSGSISDSSGARVPGARVTLTNVNTNVQQVSETTDAGTYAFVNVPPGTYNIEVTKEHFNSARETNLNLSVNQAAQFNFTLTPGSTQQSVTVSAETGRIQTTTAELGTVIVNKSVDNLPLNGRNFTQLLELTPGVSRISVAQNSAAGIDLNPIGQFTFPAVNGQRNRSNMFYLDGANNLGTYKGTYNYQPIVDDIQEFKVQSQNDLAEFGGVTGGIVNVVTKSGTNDLHGSAWEFVRNSDFDARNFFQASVNPLRQNQFGVAIGGPVILPHLYRGRNKTFFFFAYEGFRQRQQAEGLVTTATPAQLSGDFSNLLEKGVQIYNPFSTRPDPSNPGQYLRDPFPGDKIPAALLSPASVLYAKTLFPAPAISGNPAGNAYINTPLSTNSNSYTGRLDYAFNERDQVFVRASLYDEPYVNSVGSPIAVQQDDIGGYNIVAHEIHAFGPSTVLEGHFSRDYGQNILHIIYPGAPANFGSTLIASGFSSAFIGNLLPPVNQTIPTVSIPGYLSLSGNIYQNPSVTDTYEYAVGLSKIIGKHTFKAGATISTDNFSQAIVAVTEATSTFQTANLEHPTSASGAPTGDALASFLLGVPTSAQRRNADEIERGGWANGFYFQDQIRLTPKLSVNLGVRWDVAVWPRLVSNNSGLAYFGDMNLTNGTYILSAVPPACSSTVGAPCIPNGTLPAGVVVSPHHDGTIHNTDFSNWQGRLGVAYQLGKRAAVRAGYGRFYDEWSIVDQIAQNLVGTWPTVGLINANSLNQSIPSVTIGDPLQLGTKTILPPATPFGNATFYYDPNMLSPRSDQWNVGIETSFGSSTTLSVNYVGARNSRLDYGALTNTARFPAPGSAAQVASRRPYPFIVPTNFDQSNGTSNYNALQTALKKRTGGGLTYLISYTYSKSMDVGCSGSFGSEGCLVQNPANPSLDRSVSGFDLTHIFSASVVYDLPFGTGRALSIPNSIANSILGGWQINAIASFSSGTPYSVTVNGDLANIGNTFVQANLVGNPMPANQTPAEWINPAAFVAPPAYTFGTLGRNALRSDWYKDLDLSLFKVFRLPRETGLEFRAEAFNITNTPVFAAPNSVVGSPTFGVVSRVGNSPRQLQLALKLRF